MDSILPFVGASSKASQALPPGEHYEGWLKHPFYGQSKALRLQVTRLAMRAGAPQDAEPQFTCTLEGQDMKKAFGQDGLRRLVDQVDRQGEVQGNLKLQDPNSTQNFQEGTFQLKKLAGPQGPNAPNPLDLANLRFGSATQAELEHDQGWRKWASQNGVPMAEAKPVSDKLEAWYQKKNNWGDMLDKCAHEKAMVNFTFTGQTRRDHRNVAPQFLDNVASSLFEMTGGSVGQPWNQQDHTKTVQVKDVFQDKAFGSPASHNQKSWVALGDPSVTDDHVQPAKWERLDDAVVGRPYPISAGGDLAPMATKVYQGSLDNFYFVQACCAISMKSQLVQDLFMNCAYSEPNIGMHMLRFFKMGRWEQVVIDGFLPYDQDGNPMCCRSDDFPGNAWPSLVEKAYAKLHGSWMALGDKGGDVEDVLIDLTGGCAGRFGTTDVAADRMWKYLSFLKHTTVWAVSIDQAQCSVRNIPIAKNWAAAIFDVAMHPVQNIPLIGIFTSAPFSSVKHFPLVDMGPQFDIHLGYMWLRIDDFAQLFSDVFECRLVNSDLALVYEKIPRPIGNAAPRPPGRPPSGWNGSKFGGHASGPWYETLWGFSGVADMGHSPSFLMHVEDDTELVMSIGQECGRYVSGLTHQEKRFDTEHGIHDPVTYAEYQTAMETKYRELYSRKDIALFWDELEWQQDWNQEQNGYIERLVEAPLLLRFFQLSGDTEFISEPKRMTDPSLMPVGSARSGEMHLVHMSAWAHTRCAMCCVKVHKKGSYLAQVSMPPQYSCRGLVFRTYTNKDISVSSFEWPKNMVVTNAGHPLGATPYSLTGLPRIDSSQDHLPRMFDDEHGKGRPSAGPPWVWNLKEKIEPDWENSSVGVRRGGPKILGEFGGADAIATQSARETQASGGSRNVKQMS